MTLVTEDPFEGRVDVTWMQDELKLDLIALEDASEVVLELLEDTRSEYDEAVYNLACLDYSDDDGELEFQARCWRDDMLRKATHLQALRERVLTLRTKLYIAGGF